MTKSKKSGIPFKQHLIGKAIPVLATVVAYSIGYPWYAAVLILLTAQYWYGPVLIYIRIRMPISTPLKNIDTNQELPIAHTTFYDMVEPVLQGIGFQKLGRYVSINQKRGMQIGTVEVLQHPESSDIAQLMVVTSNIGTISAEVISFSRLRTDGSRIYTTRSSIASPFPPNPNDDVLRINGSLELNALWRIHQYRVTSDINATRNEIIHDGLLYQMEREHEGARRNIQSGRWKQGEQPNLLRPTAIGALFFCLRMLTPWKQLTRINADKQVRRILAQSNKPE